MKKLLVVVFVSVCMAVLPALDVDRKELDTLETQTKIEFINYNGPYSVINTVEEIRAIGSSLGSSILSKGTSGDKSKYYVIHAIDSSVTTGFDADIMILGNGVGVDHIDNLRRILSSYLATAYNYSSKDADTLATFITVYNAVYRGKIETFNKRYKPIVTKNLTAEKVGLSVRYDEWPDRSQIVIPLSEPRLSGTISTIDTTTLTGKEVVEKLKEDSVTATDTRKDMVDLKDRETDAAQKRADTAQQDATKARTDETKKKDELAVAEKEAQIAKGTAEQLKTQESQKVADEKTAIVEQKKADVIAAQEKTMQKEDAAKADQTLADTKQKEVQAERKEIATDVQKDLNAQKEESKAATEAALASAIPGYCLKVIDGTSLVSEIVLVNLADGTIMKTSPLNSILGRTLYDTGNGLIAIAGKKGGNSAIKLALIDPKTLEMTKQGIESIAEKSMLVQNVNDYYAIIDNSGTFVVGRFDKNLDVKAKSAISVQPYTPITVTAKGILVQDSSGNIKLLRATDLTDQSK